MRSLMVVVRTKVLPISGAALTISRGVTWNCSKIGAMAGLASISLGDVVRAVGARREIMNETFQAAHLQLGTFRARQTGERRIAQEVGQDCDLADATGDRQRIQLTLGQEIPSAKGTGSDRQSGGEPG